MPYKSDKIKLPPTKDRRRKLTDEQKEEIRRIYATGVCGMGRLAKQFGVSKATIQIIVNPNVAERKRQYIKEHWSDYRPSKGEWAKTMKKYRNYKHELYLKGEI